MKPTAVNPRNTGYAHHRTVKGVELSALRSFWVASKADRARFCNGAGPEWVLKHARDVVALLPFPFGLLAYLVRRYLIDGLLGLDCRIVFDIHDWDYTFLGKVPSLKTLADERLAANLDVWIRSRTRLKWLIPLRLRVARDYGKAVREWGYKAFFDQPGGGGS